MKDSVQTGRIGLPARLFWLFQLPRELCRELYSRSVTGSDAVVMIRHRSLRIGAPARPGAPPVAKALSRSAVQDVGDVTSCKSQTVYLDFTRDIL